MCLFVLCLAVVYVKVALDQSYSSVNSVKLYAVVICSSDSKFTILWPFIVDRHSFGFSVSYPAI